MKNLLSKLQGVGKLEGRGEFTLDVEKAGAKMARFQFRDEAEFLKHLVAGLFHLGALSVRVRPEKNGLRVEVPGLKLPPNVPRDLPLSLLDETSPLRRLAAATQAILGHRPEQFFWTGVKSKQSYELVGETSAHWQSVQLQELYITGLPAALVKQAVEHLRKYGRYSRRPLYIDQAPISAMQPLEGDKLGPHRGHFYLAPDLKGSQLLLVVDEILSDPKDLKLEIPWHGVFYWHGPPPSLDASLSSVVENEAYQKLVKEIPSTFQLCIGRELQNPERKLDGRMRELCCELLLRNSQQVEWLQTSQAMIREQPLVRDQYKKHWSLNALRRLDTTVYHSPAPPEREFEVTILIESNPRILQALAHELGPGSFQEATPLVLTQLLREHNQRRWNERAPQPLALPPDDWMIQRNVELELGRTEIGIAADWSEPGGCLHVFQAEKFLIQVRLPHTEIAYTAVIDVKASAVNEVWDDLTPAAHEQIQLQLTYQVLQLAKDLVDGDTQAAIGPARLRLLKHLSRSKRPETSYFAKTLLFRDHQNHPYSLYSLLIARGTGQTIAWLPTDHADIGGFPANLLPPAVWVVGEDEVWKCLSSVAGLSAKNLSELLKDLERIRTAPPVVDGPFKVDFSDEHCNGTLHVKPTFSHGTVHLCVDGHWMEPISAPSDVGYSATLHCSKIKFNIQLDSQKLGATRWSMIANQQAWKKCQGTLAGAVHSSLNKVSSAAPESLGPEWFDFIEHALLLGWGPQYPGFHRIVCLQTLPRATSMDQLLQLSKLYWCTSPLDEQQHRLLTTELGDVVIWPKLKPVTQSALADAYPSLTSAWECLDGWLASKAKMTEFLRLPALRPEFRHALASRTASGRLSGVVAFDPDSPGGDIVWTHLERSICRDPGDVPPGLRGILESSDLQPDETFTALGPPEALHAVRKDALEQMGRLLYDWLGTPQPDFSRFLMHWPDWVKAFPYTLDVLKQQPWFDTSHGWKSWQQLMEAPSIYWLDVRNLPLPPDELFVRETKCPTRLLDSLFSQHPNGFNSKQTQQMIKDWQRRKEREQLVRLQQQRMQNHPYKLECREPAAGEVAYVTTEAKDCWLVLSGRVVPIENLPAGLTGYLETSQHTLRRIGGQELAELQLQCRKDVLAQLAPLYVRRMLAGKLKSLDLSLIAAYMLAALHGVSPEQPGEPWSALAEARWIPLADGSRTSLAQLRLESQERKELLFWTRTYTLAPRGPELTPILTDPLLIQLVKRWCGVEPHPRAKPLLYQDVTEVAKQPLGSFRQVLVGLGGWAQAQAVGGVRQGMRLLAEGQSRLRSGIDYVASLQPQPRVGEESVAASPRQFAETEELDLQGRPVLTALRRQASSLLNGVARRETLKLLDRARWVRQNSKELWRFPPGQPVELNANHPRLKKLLRAEEPPAPIVLSLLLGLVSVVNARSQPFTDAMELQFLDEMLSSVVDSYQDQIPEL